MAKTKKISSFRTLNTNIEITPTKKKNVGAVSARKEKPQENEGYYREKKSHTVGIAIFFLILIILGAIVGCLFTPVFNVENIVFVEGEHITRDEIMSKFDDIQGQNIFRVNISSIKKSILEMPYIRHVDINRILPNTLSVTFEERKPYAIIKYLESFVIMDKYGYVLEIKKENDLQDLAIIYGINSDEFVIGEKLEDVAGLKYENVTYLLETAYNSDFDYTIYEINYDDTEKLVMAVRELDIDVVFGEIDKNGLTEKVRYLNGILKNLDGKKGKLDISSNSYLEKAIFVERY